MSVQTGHVKLNRAMKDLLVRWNRTKGAWTDEVSRRFEEEHLMPLASDVRSTLRAMGEMAALLNRVRRDCE